MELRRRVPRQVACRDQRDPGHRDNLRDRRGRPRPDRRRDYRRVDRDSGWPGLAIIGFDGWRIEPTDLSIEEQLFLPVRASRDDHRFQLVGACVRPDGGYVPPMLRAIKALEPFIRSAPTIVAGDFNQSAEFDARRKPGPGRRFADVVGALDDLGLRSAWHAHRREQFGSESAPTHFHRSSKTSWHIDYAFVPRQIEVVGTDLHSVDDIVFTKISDHVPLTVSLADA